MSFPYGIVAYNILLIQSFNYTTTWEYVCNSVILIYHSNIYAASSIKTISTEIGMQHLYYTNVNYLTTNQCVMNIDLGYIKYKIKERRMPCLLTKTQQCMNEYHKWYIKYPWDKYTEIDTSTLTPNNQNVHTQNQLN